MKRSQRLLAIGYAMADRHGQRGFIPMILCIIFVLVAVIFFAFKRVLQVQQ